MSCKSARQVSPIRLVAPLLTVAATAFASASAYANTQSGAACDARWMHDGGGFTLTASPSGRVTTFSVRNLARKDADNCTMTINTTSEMTLAGRTMQSQSATSVQIAGGRLQKQASSNGEIHGTAGPASLSATAAVATSGLTSYIGQIEHAGQTLPETRSEASFNGGMSKMNMPLGPVGAQKLVTTTTQKRVGEEEPLDTVLGKLTCWPIRYDRTQQAAQITLPSGHALANAATTHIVEYFCPSVGLVMRTDLETNGKRASQTVSAVH